MTYASIEPQNRQEKLSENILQSLSSPIIHINHNDKTLAIILRSEFNQEGVNFITPDDFSQQLAYIKHPSGKHIIPHIHNEVQREVVFTQEVLVIKKGKLRVDFYDQEQQYLQSYILREGDIVLLVQGGHGFQVLEEVEMIEVKQGPYVGNQDKTRFTGINDNQVRIIG